MTDARAPDQEEVPVLVAAPGMPFDAVVATSTTQLDVPDDVRGTWMVQPEGPHKFKLHHAKLGFEIGPGLFSLVEADKGEVIRVRTTPHDDYLYLPAAFELVEALNQTLLASGWEARMKPNPDRIAWQLGKGPEIRAGMWRPLPDIRAVVDPSAGWRADVIMRRTVDAGSGEASFLKLEDDAYLVTLLIEDEVKTGG